MENSGEHITARQNAVHFECKKDGLKQVQSGDVKVTFTVTADDMPSSLYSAAMGQRYVIALVAVDDNETPIQKPKSYATQAVMLSKDEAFWVFLHVTKRVENPTLDSQVDGYIKNFCGVTSKADLIEGTEAGRKFKQLQAQFLEWKD